MARPFKKGDYVKTKRHGYQGRVFAFRYLNNSDQEWVDAQTIRPTIEELQVEWVSVLTRGGGSVLTPITACEKISPIDNLDNVWEKEYFR